MVSGTIRPRILNIPGPLCLNARNGTHISPTWAIDRTLPMSDIVAIIPKFILIINFLLGASYPNVWLSQSLA